MKRIRSMILAGLAIGLSSQAQAIPVTWTLQNVTFDDGGTASGSFVFDATTSTVSAVAITTTTNAPFGASYTQWSGFFCTLPTCVNFEDATLDLDPLLTFTLASAMTNAGGTIAISPTNTIFSAEHNDILSVDRYIVSGAISTVPIPAAVWLFGSALGVMGWMRRKAGA